MTKFRALAVADDEWIRKVIVDLFRDTVIDCEVYFTPEELLAHLYPGFHSNPADMHDLLVIDLKLRSDQKTGADLIRDLADRDIPSEIIAISCSIPSLDLTDDIILLGASVLLPRSFGPEEFWRKAKRLAEIGEKRRMRRIKGGESSGQSEDPARQERPVFISCAKEDGLKAKTIRKQLESEGIDVWYPEKDIPGGAEWLHKIESYIDDTYIFVPLFSDAFFRSDYCKNELSRFRKRMEEEEKGKQKLHLLPVVDNLTDQGRANSEFQSIEQTYQLIELRPQAWDRLMEIKLNIQMHLYSIGHESAPQLGKAETPGPPEQIKDSLQDHGASLSSEQVRENIDHVDEQVIRNKTITISPLAGMSDGEIIREELHRYLLDGYRIVEATVNKQEDHPEEKLSKTTIENVRLRIKQDS